MDFNFSSREHNTSSTSALNNYIDGLVKPIHEPYSLNSRRISNSNREVKYRFLSIILIYRTISY